jgi:hypothetical protein
MREITKTEPTKLRYHILIIFLLFLSSQLLAKPVSVEQLEKASDTISQNRGLELYSGYYQKNDGQVEVYYDSIEDGKLVGGKVTLALPPVWEYQSIIQAPPLWNYETVINSGPSGNRIDIVVVGDGYTQSELNKYQLHTNNILSGYFAQEPLASYINFFNVHRVDVISNESGVDESDYNIYRDTALDMAYNCGGLSRLLCINTAKAWDAASVAPDADQMLALANSTRYGGAGYSNLATMAGDNSWSVELALHEFGHSFGKLADEYDYGGNETYTDPEPSQINVSIYNAQQQTDLQTKWYRWLYLPNVDTYEGALYCKYGIYRPTDNSKMRSLSRPFEEVNVEQFIFRIYENVSIIDDSTPLSDEPISCYTDFYIVPVEPTPNTIDIQWYIDGQPVPGANAKTFSPDISNLAIGLHEISVTVTDNTSMVRDEIKRAQLMTKSLRWQILIIRYSGGTGSPMFPYRIATPEDLNDIGNHQEDWNKHFILVNDVNLSGYTGTQFKSIGRYIEWNDPNNKPFTGVFDGNEKSIWNFTLISDSRNSVGLFGYIGYSGQIKNLALQNADVNAVNSIYVGGLVGFNQGSIINCFLSGSINGYHNVGGLVGTNDAGTITNCYSRCNILGTGWNVGGLVGANDTGTITVCSYTGAILGGSNVGGVVGDNDTGTIIDCDSTGSVSGGADGWNIGGIAGFSDGEIMGCYSTCGVDGNSLAAGLVGHNCDHGTITNCYSTGSVSGAYYVGGLVGYNHEAGIDNCYSTGSVSGTGWFIGGLIGFHDPEGFVRDSFWDIETSGQSTSSGGTGKKTAEMKTMTTFASAGWDFVNIWDICEGTNYPRLRWQIPPARARGDFLCPYGVDFVDFAVLASAWQSKPNDANWNAACDISQPKDNFIDELDLAVLCENWLEDP